MYPLQQTRWETKKKEEKSNGYQNGILEDSRLPGPPVSPIPWICLRLPYYFLVLSYSEHFLPLVIRFYLKSDNVNPVKYLRGASVILGPPANTTGGESLYIYCHKECGEKQWCSVFIQWTVSFAPSTTYLFND